MGVEDARGAISHDPVPKAISPCAIGRSWRIKAAFGTIRGQPSGVAPRAGSDSSSPTSRSEVPIKSREMEKKGQKGSSAPSSTGGSGSGGAPQGMHGGMGGGMHGGGMHGSRMGGRPPASGSGGGKEADRAATLEDRLDENDTKAYLDAERVFTEP